MQELSTLSRVVAVDVLVNGAQSRAQLAKKMGLSPATLTRLVRPLLDAGILVESGALRTGARGRSSLALDVVDGARRFIGVKLTSDSIYAVLTNLRAEILDSEVRKEPSLEVGDIVAAVAEQVDALTLRAAGAVDAVGVTVGGRVDNGETVADSPFLHWHAVPFRTLLAERVEAPLYLANDVVGLTTAQQWFGYGRSYADFALITVGAGVGYGLVIDHELVATGATPVSHLAIDPYGPLCPRGHRGCMTAYVTSGAMTSAVSQGLGRRVGYDELLRLAEHGHPLAGRVVQEAAHALGRAASAVTSLTGVERIILSGEGVALAEVAAAHLRAGCQEYADGHAVQPVVRPMTFLEWARGAAAAAIKATFPVAVTERRAP
ncbi:MAG TPA: ROK family transcriptional regulator [Actinomycetales bacterium]|jgi:predicted NBD/HSP70 family sugar kinase|nr:ROK family transcriptional regulator [Actinomycetales bacterium]